MRVERMDSPTPGTGERRIALTSSRLKGKQGCNTGCLLTDTVDDVEVTKSKKCVPKPFTSSKWALER
jgi:hypothetical protein